MCKTIFAMPVFDFENDWRDMYFRETSDDTKPVLSSYFWIYLLVSATLTAFTVFGWWYYTKSTSREQKRKRALKAKRQPTFVVKSRVNEYGKRWYMGRPENDSKGMV